MPKEGYYVYKFDPEFDTPGDIDVIYTTGIAGKGGHMYYRIEDGDNWGWNILTWTCVPDIKDMEKNYDYYETLPKGIPVKPTVDELKQKKNKH